MADRDTLFSGQSKSVVRIILFKFLKLYFTTDFTDFTDLGCASLLLFHRFFYDYSGQGRDWLRVANNLCNLELIAALPQKSK